MEKCQCSEAKPLKVNKGFTLAASILVLISSAILFYLGSNQVASNQSSNVAYFVSGLFVLVGSVAIIVLAILKFLGIFKKWLNDNLIFTNGLVIIYSLICLIENLINNFTSYSNTKSTVTLVFCILTILFFSSTIVLLVLGSIKGAKCEKCGRKLLTLGYSALGSLMLIYLVNASLTSAISVLDFFLEGLIVAVGAVMLVGVNAPKSGCEGECCESEECDCGCGSEEPEEGHCCCEQAESTGEDPKEESK